MSLKITVVVACVLVLAAADRPPVYGAPPSYAPPAPKYSAPASYNEPSYPDEPPIYNFNYGIADQYSGANFGHTESRDGYNTQGSYTVNLPDGRKQTVTYYDNGDGYVAEVTYEGEAQYPEYTPSYKPAPVYKPAPSYQPAHAYRPAPSYQPAPVYN